MKKILISSCLLGENVKYNGKNNLIKQELIRRLKKNFILIPVCPEVLGGLSIPRTPSEIKSGMVFDQRGKDVTPFFIKGAEKTLQTAKETGAAGAVLKERSPSCGVHTVYDGTFSKELVAGKGVTAKLLADNGIKLFSEEEITECIYFL